MASLSVKDDSAYLNTSISSSPDIFLSSSGIISSTYLNTSADDMMI